MAFRGKKITFPVFLSMVCWLLFRSISSYHHTTDCVVRQHWTNINIKNIAKESTVPTKIPREAAICAWDLKTERCLRKIKEEPWEREREREQPYLNILGWENGAWGTERLDGFLQQDSILFSSQRSHIRIYLVRFLVYWFSLYVYNLSVFLLAGSHPSDSKHRGNWNLAPPPHSVSPEPKILTGTQSIFF